MRAGDEYVEKLASSWHANIQRITYGHLPNFKPTEWELESGGCKCDIRECFSHLIEEGLIPTSASWEMKKGDKA